MYLPKSNLMQDALASQQLSTEANDETHHCQTAIPLFGKRGETKFCVIHDFGSIFNNVTDYVVCLRSAVISDTKGLKNITFTAHAFDR